MRLALLRCLDCYCKGYMYLKQMSINLASGDMYPHNSTDNTSIILSPHILTVIDLSHLALLCLNQYKRQSLSCRSSKGSQVHHLYDQASSSKQINDELGYHSNYWLLCLVVSCHEIVRIFQCHDDRANMFSDLSDGRREARHKRMIKLLRRHCRDDFSKDNFNR